jgi:two-component system CheB/CheR fusion protein
MGARGLNLPVQIFATDIDNRAIASARAGVFPAGISSDVSPERLKRFFNHEPQGNVYRVKKYLRDMLIFSEQNIIRDPPFSKLDLISCRNFLIYIDKDLQNKLIGLFDYSLNPRGLLFLGNSENIGKPDLFSALDHTARLFQSVKDRSNPQKIVGQILFPSSGKLPQVAFSGGDINHIQTKKPLREITEQALLYREDMAGALVNSRGDVVYLHGRTGLYLDPIIAFREHHTFNTFKHVAVPVFGLLANLLCMIFYLVGPFFVAGMSYKEPYIALGIAAAWGIYGAVYFLRESRRKNRPVLLASPAAEIRPAGA